MLTFNKNLKTIGFSEFNVPQLRKEVKKIVLPNGLTSIRDFAFKDCNNLEEVVFPETIEYIGRQAFSDCVKLKALNIKSKSLKIDTYAFYNCPLYKINIETAKRAELGHSTFEETKIEDFNVHLIDYHGDTFPHSFHKTCKNISFFVENLDVLDYDLYYNIYPERAEKFAIENVKVYSIKDNLWMENFIFEESDGCFLTYYPHHKKDSIVKVPEGTKRIDSNTFFSNPFIETLILPDSLKILRALSCKNLQNLKEVIILSNDFEISDSLNETFKMCPKLSSIYLTPDMLKFHKSKLDTRCQKIVIDVLIKGNNTFKDANKILKDLER